MNLKYLLPLIAIITISCSQSINFIPGYISKYQIDFSKFSDEEFLFTPYKYLADYKSIGLIDVTIMPPALKETKLVRSEVGPSYTEEYWKFEEVDLEKALTALKEDVKQMGADAIIEFRLERVVDTHTDGASLVYVSGIKLSGFAIKRLGAFK